MGDGDEGRQGLRWAHGELDGLNLTAVLVLTWLVRSGLGITTRTILGHTLRICLLGRIGAEGRICSILYRNEICVGLLCVFKARTARIQSHSYSV